MFDNVFTKNTNLKLKNKNWKTLYVAKEICIKDHFITKDSILKINIYLSEDFS